MTDDKDDDGSLTRPPPINPFANDGDGGWLGDRHPG